MRKKYKRNIKTPLFSIIFMFLFTIIFSFAYSAFNMNLNITGEAAFRVQGDIRLTKISYNNNSTGTELYNSDYAKDTINIGANVNSNTKVIYDVEITNTKNVPMALKEVIKTDSYNNSNVTYKVTYTDKSGSIKELNASNTAYIDKLSTLIVHVEFSSKKNNQTLNGILKFIFIEKESILAKGTDSSTTFLNTSPINRSQVENITFQPTIEIADEALGYWDASAEKNEMVMAYYVEAEDYETTGLYDVYIGGYGPVYANPSSSYLFVNFTSLKSINFNDVNDKTTSYFDTSKVTSMSSMFRECKNLISLDLSNFNTSGVTSMSNMFYNCGSILTLDLTSFNTEQVTSMANMFCKCFNLTSVDLSSFRTPELESMASMFYQAQSITNIDLSSFNTSNVTTIGTMFYYCTSLQSVDLSSFDTTNVKNMGSLFQFCSQLKELDIKNFNTENVTNMSTMFLRCQSLKELDVTNFNTSQVTSMQSMFCNMPLIKNLDLRNFDTTNVTTMKAMFESCNALENLYIDPVKFNTTNVTDMSTMFKSCYNIISLDLSRFNTSNVENFYGMFHNCNSLTTLDVSSFNTSSAISMSNMFAYCTKVTQLDLSSFNTSNVTTLESFASNCYALENVILSSFDTSNVTNFTYMFKSCSSLKNIDLTNFTFLDEASFTSFIPGSITTINISNVEKDLLLEKLSDTENNIYKYILNNISKTAVVYVNDSDCITLVTNFKSTLQPQLLEEIEET